MPEYGERLIEGVSREPAIGSIVRGVQEGRKPLFLFIVKGEVRSAGLLRRDQGQELLFPLALQLQTQVVLVDRYVREGIFAE